MILINDDFESILTSIKEGRKMFDNLQKSLAYTLASNVAVILPIILNLILLMPSPLSATLMIAILFITDIFPALSLTYTEAEDDIMTRKPRN